MGWWFDFIYSKQFRIVNYILIYTSLIFVIIDLFQKDYIGVFKDFSAGLVLYIGFMFIQRKSDF